MIARQREAAWAVVLAAGEGTRLAMLTRALHGRDLPKQFAVIDGSRSLLQATMDRIGERIPPHRTLVVVGARHADVARAQLAEYPGVDLVLQPRNLETGPGILLPLARLRARDPDALVAIFPSDHYVPSPVPLLDAVDAALAAASDEGDLVTLLGVVPDRPEVEYGWIEPGLPIEPGRAELRSVRRFVEKPPADVAQQLMRRGGLWNTFVSVGQIAAYWSLALRHLPEQAALFELYRRAMDRPDEAATLESIYRRMEPASFSRAILERAERLAVVPVARSGWSDWGSPARVFRSLEGSASLAALRERLAVPAQAVGLAS